MYVSQVPVTIIYTLLKITLLFLLSSIVAPLCILEETYAVAKIFQQGRFTILYGLVNKHYKGYSYVFYPFLVIITSETVIIFYQLLQLH